MISSWNGSRSSVTSEPLMRICRLCRRVLQIITGMVWRKARKNTLHAWRRVLLSSIYVPPDPLGVKKVKGYDPPSSYGCTALEHLLGVINKALEVDSHNTDGLQTTLTTSAIQRTAVPLYQAWNETLLTTLVVIVWTCTHQSIPAAVWETTAPTKTKKS